MKREFPDILARHLQAYPEMTPQDACKLAYQSEFGPEHLLTDMSAWRTRLKGEWEQAGQAPVQAEAIGGGLCRFHLDSGCEIKTALPLLEQLVRMTAAERHRTRAGLEEKLDCIAARSPDAKAYVEQYRANGCPTLHHSDVFRTVYVPHYQVIGHLYGAFFPVLLAIWQRLRQDKPVIVSIDGRCGSGKTGFAELIGQIFPCNIVHMDDYYLPQDERVPNWESIVAGNINLLRVRRELLEPARQGKPILYRPYNCQTGNISREEQLPARQLTVVEGSYSQHPDLRDYYDLTVFLTCDPATQARRLSDREGDYYPAFQTSWIPMEERYHQAVHPESSCDFTVDTGNLF